MTPLGTKACFVIAAFSGKKSVGFFFLLPHTPVSFCNVCASVLTPHFKQQQHENWYDVVASFGNKPQMRLSHNLHMHCHDKHHKAAFQWLDFGPQCSFVICIWLNAHNYWQGCKRNCKKQTRKQHGKTNTKSTIFLLTSPTMPFHVPLIFLPCLPLVTR